jgi:acyl carrier protein
MTHKPPLARSADDIRQWLIDALRRHLPPGADDVRTDQPVVSHGIDSMQFVSIVGELEEWLGCRFADNPLIDYPTIDALSEFLAERLEKGETVIKPAKDL